MLTGLMIFPYYSGLISMSAPERKGRLVSPALQRLFARLSNMLNYQERATEYLSTVPKHHVVPSKSSSFGPFLL